jgi:3-hydroxyisobutyrate dehydrogenase
MTATSNTGQATSVAVLGTGIMGAAMARNLLKAGLRTSVWDRSPGATAPLAEAGARVADSAPDAVRAADVVITMLPTADVVKSVVLGSGVVQALGRGAVWAQMGTICVAETDDLSAEIAAARPDVLFVDAPVSGPKARLKLGSC